KRLSSSDGHRRSLSQGGKKEGKEEKAVKRLLATFWAGMRLGTSPGFRPPPGRRDRRPSRAMYPAAAPAGGPASLRPALPPAGRQDRDRKSTRLNSSHVKISYAVFCLKKKKTIMLASDQN